MTGDIRQLTLTFWGATALVTGAGSGIGRATSELLLSCGIRVVAVDVRMPAPGNELSGDVTYVVADVRDRGGLETQLRDLGVTPDYVVNCAGILDSSGFAEVSSEDFTRVLEINLLGAYQVLDVARSLGSLLAVVNVTSIEATRVVAISNSDPNPAYAASKAALSMLTRTAARALAGSGARVNSVAPGFVMTPMAFEHGDGGTIPPKLRERVPMGAFATPKQIAEPIAFLLSDQASFITGAELLVDGGFQQT